MAEKFTPVAKNSSIDTDFVPNVLDLFDVPSYHLKFFMLSENDVKNQVFDSSRGIIIAESGVTSRVFIEEFNLKTANSPNNKSLNVLINEISFTIREFLGASLLDQMYYGSLELGISNHQQIPFFMELTFTGRDPNSSSPSVQVIGGKKWVWPLMIRTIETDVDAGGAVHEFTAALYDEIALDDKVTTMDTSINLTNVKTIAEALQALEDALNARAKDKESVDTGKADIIRIMPSDEFGDFALTDDLSLQQSSQKANTNQDVTPGSLEKREINFRGNETIISAINKIVTSAPKYQEFAKNMKDDKKEVKPEAKAETKKLHRIVAKSKMLEYDEGRGDYQKQMTYLIVPYETGLLQLDKSEQAVTSAAKLKTYTNKKVLRKRYNYLFTGTNDQILDFNIRISSAWYAAVPKQGGFNTQYASAAEGVHLDDEKIKKAQKHNKNKTTSEAFLPTPSPDSQEAVDANDGVPPLIAAPNNDAIPDSEEGGVTPLLSTPSETAKKAEKVIDEPASPYTGKQRFITDYDPEKPSVRFKRYPITYSETEDIATDRKVEMNKDVETGKGTGRPYINSLFTQAFSMGDGNMSKIELKVKGDPFWLEPSPIMNNTGYAGIESPEPSAYVPSDDQVNTTVMHNYILFTTRTAAIPDDTTGVANLKSTYYNGVYGVNQVEHNFANGLFTQTLIGAIDPIIDVTGIDGD